MPSKILDLNLPSEGSLSQMLELGSSLKNLISPSKMLDLGSPLKKLDSVIKDSI